MLFLLVSTVFFNVVTAEAQNGVTYFVDQFPNEPIYLEGWVEVVPGSCTVVSEGSWQVTMPPKYGTVATTIEYGTGGSGACIGSNLPFNVLTYTWTSTAPISTTDPIAVDDTFSATWLLASGQPDVSYNFDIAFPCPNPTITSITPGKWIAGSVYSVTITGTNFITAANATNLCPVSSVTVTTPSGTVVAITNVNVVSAAQITATVAPPAGEPTETAAVTVGANDYSLATLGADGYSLAAATVPAQIMANLSAIITDTSDIMDGNVTVNLTAPSGTTGDLNLDFNGTDATKMLELSQAPFPALSPGEQELTLPFDTILPGIYTMANGTWDALVPGAAAAQSVTVPDYTLPTPWTYFRKIYYTQYNVPHESSCTGGDANAWIVSASVVHGRTRCSFTKVKLNAHFIAATWMNGTGVDLEGDVLKNAAVVNLGDKQRCAGQYPSGAVGDTRSGGNTFEIVSSVTGSCNATLVAGQSVAMPCTQIGKQCPVAVVSGVQALSCGDQLNLDSGK